MSRMNWGGFRRAEPFHLNPSCNRKNSLKAASFLKSRNCLHSLRDRFCGDNLALLRQICASKPSICRSPLRILVLSREERLLKDKASRDSIASSIVAVIEVKKMM